MLMDENISEDECVVSHIGSRRSDYSSDTDQNVTEQASTILQSRECVDEYDGLVEPDHGQAIRSASQSRQSSKRTTSTFQRQHSRSFRKKQSVDALLTSEYRKIFIGMVEDAERHFARSTLPDSPQAGDSLWTSAEKSALFHSLSRRKSGDLQLLAEAIRSKSKLEIQAYLSIALETTRLPTQESTASSEGALIAFEISPKCEEYLDSAADVLATRHEEHEATLQRKKFDDQWLIDEDMAAQEDLHYQTLLSTRDGTIDAQFQSGGQPSVANSTSSSDITALLRPTAFLELSRILFMNNGEHEELNWHHIEPITDVSLAPAIYRSALNNLQTIVVNLTRRMVQLCLFQANTRLRAGDSSRNDWTPLAAVREVDVRKALEMSGMDHSWHKYWAHVSNRCCVAAYSDSKKYKDGRQGTKIGFRLSADEVRAELDPCDSEISRSRDPQQAESLDGHDLNEVMWEDERFTASSASPASDREPSSRKNQDVLKTSLVKRERAQSADSFEHKLDACLEARDKKASACEEQRMYKALNLEPPSDVQQKATEHQSPSAQETNPSSPWQHAVDYESDWEQALGYPTEDSFIKVHGQCARAQKRRRLLADQLNYRSQSSSHPTDD